MIITDGPIKSLFDKITAQFEGSVKNYGEAIRSLSTNQAANFITADNSSQCAVDDSYRLTLFIVRESADATQTIGGGTNRLLSRTVVYRMAVNSKSIQDEYLVTHFINQIPKLTYLGSSFDQAAISAAYFGISERDTASAFFTISFSVVETIDCRKNVC